MADVGSPFSAQSAEPRPGLSPEIANIIEALQLRARGEFADRLEEANGLPQGSPFFNQLREEL